VALRSFQDVDRPLGVYVDQWVSGNIPAAQTQARENFYSAFSSQIAQEYAEQANR
jgi:hypothetical protein